MSDVRPQITIRYCTQCRWLLRAAWLAQELLSTFGTDLGEVALPPGTGGVFEITYDGETIWERKADGGFPDAKMLKRRLRDRLNTSRDLGPHRPRQRGRRWGVRLWRKERSLPFVLARRLVSLCSSMRSRPSCRWTGATGSRSSLLTTTSRP
jgi:selenoprotein W-related protein